MSKISPDLLKKQLADGLIDENTAIGLIIFNIDNSKADEERVQYLKIINEIEIRDKSEFKFLENLVVSDLCEQVKVSALEICVSKYSNEVTELIKWVIDNIYSPSILLIAMKKLNQIDENQLKDLLIGGLEEFMRKKPIILLQEYSFHLRRLFKVKSFREFPLIKIFDIYLNLKTMMFLIQSYNMKFDEYDYGIEYSLKEGLVFSLKLWGLNIKKITELKQLKYLTCLEHLDVSGNNINTIDGLEPFKNLKNLKFGDLLERRGNKIVEIKGLDNLINLEHLDLSYNEINEINGLHNLRKLKSLKLAGNKLKIITFIDNLLEIETLHFEYNWISEVMFTGQLPHLSELYLDNNQLIKVDLGNLPYLEVITITSNPLVEITGLDKLDKLNEIIIEHDQLLEIRGLERQSGFSVQLNSFKGQAIPWSFKVEEIEKYKKLIMQNKKKKKI